MLLPYSDWTDFIIYIFTPMFHLYGVVASSQTCTLQSIKILKVDLGVLPGPKWEDFFTG